MKTLLFIAIAIMAAFLAVCAVLRPRWWRIAWAISAFLAAGLSAPFLIETTPDDYRFITYIGLCLLVIAGVAPLAERRC